MKDNIYNSSMNFITIMFNKFISDYNEYKNDFNTMTNKAKKYIKNTFNKYTSLIIVLILLYFLKDFLMWLLIKFDKLLKD
jgi:hypothetical protein